MSTPECEPEHTRVLSFEPSAHRYYVDNVPVPWSVTQLLEAAGVSPDYRKVHPAVLQHARLRGLHVDACCDLDDRDDLDYSTIHPEALGFLQGWQAFKADYGYEPILQQPLLYHPIYE